MKKYKTFLVAALILPCVLLLTACGSSGSSTLDKNRFDPFFGTFTSSWIEQEASEDFTNYNITLTISSGGTFIIDVEYESHEVISSINYDNYFVDTGLGKWMGNKSKGDTSIICLIDNLSQTTNGLPTNHSHYDNTNYFTLTELDGGLLLTGYGEAGNFFPGGAGSIVVLTK